MDPVGPLLDLVNTLSSCSSLEAMLDAGARAGARLLEVDRVTIRVLDETRARLLLGARFGEPLHAQEVTFELGEGLVGWVVANGRSLRVDHAPRDPRFAEKAGARTAFESFLGVPLLDAGGPYGVFSAVHPEPSAFDERHQTLAELVSGLLAPYVQGARLRRLALLDPLTAALNRRGLDERLPRSRAATPDDEPPCVLYVDIDRFKSINDEHGHEAGDQVLKAVADALAAVARHGDDVVRLGGEEFLVVLRGATLAAGARVAERARRAIGALAISTPSGLPIRVTASIGVALQSAGESRDALISRADAAMYRAKRAGRDQVAVDFAPRG